MDAAKAAAIVPDVAATRYAPSVADGARASIAKQGLTWSGNAQRVIALAERLGARPPQGAAKPSAGRLHEGS